MRSVVLAWVLAASAGAQEEDEEKKTFDVFDDEEAPPDGDLPEGDADDAPPEDAVEPVPEVAAPAEVEIDAEPIEAPPVEVDPPVVTATRAEPFAVVLVVGDAEDAHLAERIGDAASIAVGRARGLDAGTTLGALDPAATSARREAIQEGRRAIDDAMVAFEELDLEAAIEGLERGVTRLGAYAGDLPKDARDALSEGLFTLGVAALFDEDPDRADARFVGISALDPTFIPNADRYPSNVIERFDGLRASLDRRATGTLAIETNPPGASISVDGVARGSSPLTVSSLPAGTHLVTARRVGSRPASVLARVEGQASAPVELELELSGDTSRLDRLSLGLPRDRIACDDLRRAVGADLVAVLALHRRMSGTVVAGLVVGASGETIARLDDLVIVDDPEVAGRAIAQAIQDVEAAARLALEVRPDEAEPLVEQWWFWTAIGGAALVIALGATVGVVTAGDGPPRSTGVLGF